LQIALEAFADALREIPSAPSDIAHRLDDLARKADTLADHACIWSQARNVAVSGEITVWTDALRSSIATHARDFASLMPWAKLSGTGELPADIMTVLDTTPTLQALPRRCEAALKMVRGHCLQDEANESLASLGNALEKSIAAAESVCSRLGKVADDLKSLFGAMEFGFLFDSERQLLSIGYRSTDGNLDSNY